MGKVVISVLSLLVVGALTYNFVDKTSFHNIVPNLYQFTELSRSLSDSNHFKNVTVYDNGKSTNGVQINDISPETVKSGEEFAAYLSEFVKVHVFEKENEKIIADRVYTGNGVLVTKFSDFQNGDRLYLVAPGLLFVWPFVKMGHRVFITAENSPIKEPMILESFKESPRVFHIYNFFSEKEADKLIERILEIDDESNKLQQSHVGHESGKKRVSKQRTSENAFDQVSETAINIRKRVFNLLAIPKYQDDMCDGLQLLRYKQKQAYIPHTDYFDRDTTSDFKWFPASGGSNRFATVFMYLSDVTKGGQTVFPLADMPTDVPDNYNHPKPTDSRYSDPDEISSLFDKESWEFDMVQKCSTKLSAYPKKAHAILFYSQTPDGNLDKNSLHGGCPVVDGTKWGANLWVWNKRRYGLDQDVGNKKLGVDFVNNNDFPVNLFWSQTFMKALAPGEKIHYETYHSHKWVIKNEQNDVVLLEKMMDSSEGMDQVVNIGSTSTETSTSSKKEEL